MENTAKEITEEQVYIASFTQEQLNVIWDEMAKSVKSESIRFAFQTRRPVLKENFHIVIEVDNSVLADQIKEKMDSFKAYLGKKLNNNRLTIEPIVIKQSEKAYTPYTDEEKLQEMKKKNPDLEGFVNDLELQVS